MSRVTADRSCSACNWKGTHIPEDVRYVCPECGADIIGRPIPFDYKKFLKIKEAQESPKNAVPPVARQNV